MLVIAGEADSTGNGTIGAFGNGSATFAACAACAPLDELCAGVARTGVTAGGGGCARGAAGGGVTWVDGRGGGVAGRVSPGDDGFGGGAAGRETSGFLGRSHLSQRKPFVISRPHSTQVDFIPEKSANGEWYSPPPNAARFIELTP